MIGHQVALIKREIWEHRSIYITPLAIAVVLILMTLLGLVTASAFDRHVDLATLAASNLGEGERRAILMGLLTMPMTVFSIAAGITTIFYSLDTLYAERKNKSILFWRSLPLTETETVVSKLLVALFVIPLAAVAVAALTQLALLVIVSIWIAMQGGDAGHLVWSSVPLFDVWTASLIVTIAMMLWVSPFVGWFLFVSAFAKRLPLLIASMALIVLPIVEKLVLRTSFFADAIWVRTFQPPLANTDLEKIFDDDMPFPLGSESISMLKALDIGGFLASPSLWAGLIVCGLFTTAAIYVRRYRDDS
jgi:ABC-2 type transport system permease protein